MNLNHKENKMEKAYDLGALADQLKDRGLELAEVGAEVLVEELLDWLQESATLSENVYDDLLVAVVPMFKAELAKQIDKIDGEVTA